STPWSSASRAAIRRNTSGRTSATRRGRRAATRTIPIARWSASGERPHARRRRNAGPVDGGRRLAAAAGARTDAVHGRHGVRFRAALRDRDRGVGRDRDAAAARLAAAGRPAGHGGAGRLAGLAPPPPHPLAA